MRTTGYSIYTSIQHNHLMDFPPAHSFYRKILRPSINFLSSGNQNIFRWKIHFPFSHVAQHFPVSWWTEREIYDDRIMIHIHNVFCGKYSAASFNTDKWFSFVKHNRPSISAKNEKSLYQTFSKKCGINPQLNRNSCSGLLTPVINN